MLFLLNNVHGLESKCTSLNELIIFEDWTTVILTVLPSNGNDVCHISIRLVKFK